MVIQCEVVLRRGATAEQLTALGAALWRWCNRRNTGGCQHLDNQALADGIAGRLPAASPTPGRAERQGFHVRVRDDSSPDRRTTIDSLRRWLPPGGVEDVVVGGASWDVAASGNEQP